MVKIEDRTEILVPLTTTSVPPLTLPVVTDAIVIEHESVDVKANETIHISHSRKLNLTETAENATDTAENATDTAENATDAFLNTTTQGFAGTVTDTPSSTSAWPQDITSASRTIPYYERTKEWERKEWEEKQKSTEPPEVDAITESQMPTDEMTTGSGSVGTDLESMLTWLYDTLPTTTGASGSTQLVDQTPGSTDSAQTVPAASSSVSPDPCLTYNPCKNGAVCYIDQTTREIGCKCMAGFTGKLCKQVSATTASEDVTTASGDTTEESTPSIDPCISYNPCKNGATCYIDPVSMEIGCKCTTAFTGKLCQDARVVDVTTGSGDMPETSSSPVSPCDYYNPCKNGGTCYIDQTRMEIGCKCMDGFIGQICQNVSMDTTLGSSDIQGTTGMPVSPCGNYNPCQNGATCYLDQRTKELACLCPEGYTGKLCKKTAVRDGMTTLSIPESTDAALGTTSGDLQETRAGDNVTEKTRPDEVDQTSSGDVTTETISGPADTLAMTSPKDTKEPVTETTVSKDIETTARSVPTAGIITATSDIIDTTSSGEMTEDVTTQAATSKVESMTILPGPTTTEISSATDTMKTTPSGVAMSTSIDPCDAHNPCKNGATCYLDQVTKEIGCACPDGFSGRLCGTVQPTTSSPKTEDETISTEVFSPDPTTPAAPQASSTLADVCALYNPCKNGATCYLDQNTKEIGCACPDGFYGPLCRTVQTPATSDESTTTRTTTISLPQTPTTPWEICQTYNPCKNGAVCTVDATTGRIFCRCPEGFSGALCRTVDTSPTTQGDDMTVDPTTMTTTATDMASSRSTTDATLTDVSRDKTIEGVMLTTQPPTISVKPTSNAVPSTSTASTDTAQSSSGGTFSAMTTSSTQKETSSDKSKPATFTSEMDTTTSAGVTTPGVSASDRNDTTSKEAMTTPTSVDISDKTTLALPASTTVTADTTQTPPLDFTPPETTTESGAVQTERPKTTEIPSYTAVDETTDEEVTKKITATGPTVTKIKQPLISGFMVSLSRGPDTSTYFSRMFKTTLKKPPVTPATTLQVTAKPDKKSTTPSPEVSVTAGEVTEEPSPEVKTTDSAVGPSKQPSVSMEKPQSTPKPTITQATSKPPMTSAAITPSSTKPSKISTSKPLSKKPTPTTLTPTIEVDTSFMTSTPPSTTPVWYRTTKKGLKVEVIYPPGRRPDLSTARPEKVTLTVYKAVENVYNVSRETMKSTLQQARNVLRTSLKKLANLWKQCVRGAVNIVYVPAKKGVEKIRSKLTVAYSNIRKAYDYGKKVLRRTYNSVKTNINGFYNNLANHYSKYADRYKQHFNRFFNLNGTRVPQITDGSGRGTNIINGGYNNNRVINGNNRVINGNNRGYGNRGYGNRYTNGNSYTNGNRYGGTNNRYVNGNNGYPITNTGYNPGYGNNNGYGNNRYGNNGYGNTGYGNNNGYGNNRYGNNGYGNTGYGNNNNGYRPYDNANNRFDGNQYQTDENGRVILNGNGQYNTPPPDGSSIPGSNRNGQGGKIPPRLPDRGKVPARLPGGGALVPGGSGRPVIPVVSTNGYLDYSRSGQNPGLPVPNSRRPAGYGARDRTIVSTRPIGNGQFLAYNKYGEAIGLIRPVIAPGNGTATNSRSGVGVRPVFPGVGANANRQPGSAVPSRFYQSSGNQPAGSVPNRVYSPVYGQVNYPGGAVPNTGGTYYGNRPVPGQTYPGVAVPNTGGAYHGNRPVPGQPYPGGAVPNIGGTVYRNGMLPGQPNPVGTDAIHRRTYVGVPRSGYMAPANAQGYGAAGYQNRGPVRGVRYPSGVAAPDRSTGVGYAGNFQPNRPAGAAYNPRGGEAYGQPQPQTAGGGRRRIYTPSLGASHSGPFYRKTRPKPGYGSKDSVPGSSAQEADASQLSESASGFKRGAAASRASENRRQLGTQSQAQTEQGARRLAAYRGLRGTGRPPMSDLVGRGQSDPQGGAEGRTGQRLEPTTIGPGQRFRQPKRTRLRYAAATTRDATVMRSRRPSRHLSSRNPSPFTSARYVSSTRSPLSPRASSFTPRPDEASQGHAKHARGPGQPSQHRVADFVWTKHSTRRRRIQARVPPEGAVPKRDGYRRGRHRTVALTFPGSSR
ncbi:mucin-2-like [Littorina saxatilis]|uniref:mucin-2-like n=1 Tax=Littorina saxatilis TaxID=31220 RepID=UPI0038B4F588